MRTIVSKRDIWFSMGMTTTIPVYIYIQRTTVLCDTYLIKGCVEHCGLEGGDILSRHIHVCVATMYLCSQCPLWAVVDTGKHPS